MGEDDRVAAESSGDPAGQPDPSAVRSAAQLRKGRPAIRFAQRVVDQLIDEILSQTPGIRRQFDADRSGQPLGAGIMEPDLKLLARFGHFDDRRLRAASWTNTFSDTRLLAHPCSHLGDARSLRQRPGPLAA